MSNYSQDKNVNRCWFSESNILDSSLHQHLKSDPYRVISRRQMMAHSQAPAAVFWLFTESRHIRVITGWWLSSKRSHHTVRTYSDPSKWMMRNYCLCAPLPGPPSLPPSHHRRCVKRCLGDASGGVKSHYEEWPLPSSYHQPRSLYLIKHDYFNLRSLLCKRVRGGGPAALGRGHADRDPTPFLPLCRLNDVCG